jgi:hypothetical protein
MEILSLALEGHQSLVTRGPDVQCSRGTSGSNLKQEHGVVVVMGCRVRESVPELIHVKESVVTLPAKSRAARVCRRQYPHSTAGLRRTNLDLTASRCHAQIGCQPGCSKVTRVTGYIFVQTPTRQIAVLLWLQPPRDGSGARKTQRHRQLSVTV